VRLMLEVRNLHVSYGDLVVLKDVSIYVKEGEIVGIFGPNGHGKTTLLKTVSGLVRPASGEIYFEGKDLRKLPPHKIVELGVIQVPQGAPIWPELTVEENLLLGAYNSKAWAKRKENLKIVYEMFPALQERRNRRALTLSGGERQMLSIARGLMASPRLLLLDEPSLGLAPLVRQMLLKKILEIRSAGITILLSEQNVVFASEFSDRVYLLENGSIRLHGQKDEILSNEYVRKSYLGI